MSHPVAIAVGVAIVRSAPGGPPFAHRDKPDPNWVVLSDVVTYTDGMLGNGAWNFAMCRFFFLSLSLILAAGLTARAEVFVLKSGGRIEGEQLNPKRERGQPYQVRTEQGIRLALADSAVQRVIAKSDLDKQYEALLPALQNTVEGQWAMAEWCKEAGLAAERQRHLQAVVALDPNHAEARQALGYRLYGSRWLTPEQHMEHQGYARYKGAWRLKQEIEIESRKTQHELAVKKTRKDIRTWFDQVASGGRYADAAERNLDAINDPVAGPALAEILGDAQQPRGTRLQCLAILAKLPPGLANATLVRLAMSEADASVREACLEELARRSAQAVLPDFVSELKSKDNARINRAAECIERLNGKDATLSLINALVTEHRFSVLQGGAPGSMTTTFSPSGTGGAGGPGGGGMAMGGKPQVIKKQLKNASVLAALAALNPGANFQYDSDAWRDWYIQSRTTSNVDLRRNE